MKKLLVLLFLLFPVLANAYQDGANWAYGTLTSAMATDATTFTVTNGTYSSAFPTANFSVVVFSATCSTPSYCSAREIILVTSRSSSTFTIGARDQEGTSHSGSWAAGSKVWNVITEGRFDDITTNVVAGGDIIWKSDSTAADNEIARFNTTTGKSLQGGSGATLSDTGVLNLPATGTYQIDGSDHHHDYLTGGIDAQTDPGADVLIGFDNTDNITQWITLGAGLTYTHATATLDVSSGVGTGDILWDGGTDVPVAKEIVRYKDITGKKIYANTSATLGDDGTINIPSGATYNIDGSAHAHAGTEITFTPTGTIAATDLETGLAEVASEAAVASSLTSGRLAEARLPECNAQYQMLVCDVNKYPVFSDTIPLQAIYDTTYFIDDDDDGRMYVVLGDVPTGVSTAITPFEHINVTVIKPNDLADAQRDAFLVWSNESGKTFTVTEIKCWSDTTATDLNFEETDADGANNATIDAIQCAAGSGPYTDTETTITGASVEDTHLIWIDFDDSDDPGYVKCTITGYYTN